MFSCSVDFETSAPFRLDSSPKPPPLPAVPEKHHTPAPFHAEMSRLGQMSVCMLSLYAIPTFLCNLIPQWCSCPESNRLCLRNPDLHPSSWILRKSCRALSHFKGAKSNDLHLFLPFHCLRDHVKNCGCDPIRSSPADPDPLRNLECQIRFRHGLGASLELPFYFLILPIPELPLQNRHRQPGGFGEEGACAPPPPLKGVSLVFVCAMVYFVHVSTPLLDV